MKQPGEMYNSFQAKKGKLRSADSVVRGEQNASNQFKKTPTKSPAKQNADYGKAMKGAYEKTYGPVPVKSKSPSPKAPVRKMAPKRRKLKTKKYV